MAKASAIGAACKNETHDLFWFDNKKTAQPDKQSFPLSRE
jgi:hypothetical protein